MRSGKDREKRPPAQGGTERRTDRSVGDALRQAYEETVEENIPDTMLELLKKLD